MSAVKDKVWFLREGLFAKYVMSLVGLVVFVLAVNGAMETWISYRGIKTSLTDGMRRRRKRPPSGSSSRWPTSSGRSAG